MKIDCSHITSRFLKYLGKENKVIVARVSNTFTRTTNKLVRIITNTKDTLLATPEHPFLTTTGWSKAINLVKGAKLNLPGGALASMLAVQSIDTVAQVYNFEVEQKQ